MSARREGSPPKVAANVESGVVRATTSGVRLSVRAQPRASRSALTGLVDDGRGGVALKIAIAAPPVEGAANAAIVELIAKTLDVPRRAVTIAVGESGKSKLVDVEGLTVEQALERLRVIVAIP